MGAAASVLAEELGRPVDGSDVALSPEAARAEVVRLRALMREQRVGLEPGPGPGAAALAVESQRKTKEAAEIQAAAEQRRNSVIASADQKALVDESSR